MLGAIGSGRWMLGMCPVLVLSMLLVATGCGKSNVASASSSTSITKGQAVTYAQAVILRGSDIPGFVAVGGGRTGEMEPVGSIGSRCHFVTVPAGSLSATSSPTFQRAQEHTNTSTNYLPLEAVSSGVDVMRSAALASGEIATIQKAAGSPMVVKCFKRHLEQARLQVTSETGATTGPTGRLVFSRIKGSMLRYSVQGIPAYGLRISADFAIKAPGAKGPSHYYEDFLGFAVGPAVIVLSDTGSPRPFPAAIEHRLLLLLHDRAEIHDVYGP